MRVKGNNNNEFIDDYILGKLSGSALESFEIAIFNDKTLFDEYKFRSTVFNIVKTEGGLIFSEFLFNKSKQSNRFWLLPVLVKPAVIIPAVIVAIVIAILFSINLFNTSGKQKNSVPFIAQNQNEHNCTAIQVLEENLTVTEPGNDIKSTGDKEPEKLCQLPEQLANTTIQNNATPDISISHSNDPIIETTSVTFVWNRDHEENLLLNIFDNQQKSVDQKPSNATGQISSPIKSFSVCYSWNRYLHE